MTFFLTKRNKVIFKVHSFLFNVDQNAQISFLLYAVFLYQGRQLSWQFYVFEQAAQFSQFSYTEIGSFSDDFMTFYELC